MNLPTWVEHASCATHPNPDAWYADTNTPDNELARHVCAGCRVRVHCAEHAITHKEEHGIWGGLDELERRALRRARRTPIMIIPRISTPTPTPTPAQPTAPVNDTRVTRCTHCGGWKLSRGKCRTCTKRATRQL